AVLTPQLKLIALPCVKMSARTPASKTALHIIPVVVVLNAQAVRRAAMGHVRAVCKDNIMTVVVAVIVVITAIVWSISSIVLRSILNAKTVAVPRSTRVAPPSPTASSSRCSFAGSCRASGGTPVFNRCYDIDYGDFSAIFGCEG
ncbi:MAG: hypothetical protein SO314_05920, partial [Alphaproteobacteria bacterium]|nr:hypothetical protein [Alphaproteobacteria bacterium]